MPVQSYAGPSLSGDVPIGKNKAYCSPDSCREEASFLLTDDDVAWMMTAMHSLGDIFLGIALRFTCLLLITQSR